MSDKVDDNTDNISVKSDIETNVEAEEEELKQDILMYSKDDLMELRTAALSQKWPSYLDEAFKNNRGTWDPDRWHQNKKRGSTPPPSDDRNSEKGSKKDENNEAGVNKKKDIKDRLFMSETEGVVLGPQRRSFITGCQVNKDPPKDADNQSGNSSNTASKSSSQDRGERGGDHRSERGSGTNSSLRSDSNSNSRRVGSGRIRPSASTSEDYEGGPSSRGDQRGGGGRSNYGERGDSASESRCGFNRGVDRGGRGAWYDRDFDKGGGSSSRRGEGRNMTSSRKILSEQQPSDSRKDRGSNRGSRRNEEPEWMSAPINQDDMMELKGFDDSPGKEAKTFRSDIERKGIPQAKAPVKSVSPVAEEATTDEPATATSDPTSGNTGNGGFNMDDILHMDVIPGLTNILDDCNDPLMETGGESMPAMDSGGGSRFSQFFTSKVRTTSGEQQPQGQQQLEQHLQSIQPRPRKNLEHSRSSITDEVLGNINNNNHKNQRDGSPNAFMHQFLLTQNQKHHEEQQTSIKIPSPGDPGACFAPISPAAKTENPPMPPSQPDVAISPIMEMLRAGNAKTESELLGGQTAPPLPQMSEVKTAAELEATIKQRIGLQQRNDQPLPSSSSHLSAAEPRKMSPQPQQSDAGEMSAFKKFAAMMQGSNGLEKQNGNSSQPNDMNHHQQAHQGQDPHWGLGGGHPHHQQHQQSHAPQHPQRGPVIRPSPIPANAPTEHDILAEIQTAGGIPRPQHPVEAAGAAFPPQPRMQHPGIQPSRDDVLMMAAGRRLIPELLKSPEAVSLQTAVQNQGMNMLNTILFRFVYGQMEPQRREILLQVIKYYQMKGAFGPQFANHQFANPHFLNIQDSVSPTSPTPPGGNGKSNVTPGGNSTGGSGNLSVSPLPGRERVPSPQELAIHTQQIMQNALIKRKLEEQKEKARQREVDQNRRSTDSPSFAFTPTVVMKKMAADRRDSDPKPVIPELKVSTQQPLAGGASVAPSEKPQAPSGGQAMNLQNRNSPGGVSVQGGPQGMMPPRPMPPPAAQQLLFMQQQIRAQQLAALQSGRPPVDPRVLMHAQAMMGAAAPPPGPVHGPGGHAAGPRPLAPTSVPHFMPPDVMQHQQHQALHGHPAPALAAVAAAQQGGLSRFFSPEVLAQAQSGNAPPLPPLPTQKAMTLEEIERQAAAVRM